MDKTRIVKVEELAFICPVADVGLEDHVPCKETERAGYKAYGYSPRRDTFRFLGLFASMERAAHAARVHADKLSKKLFGL